MIPGLGDYSSGSLQVVELLAEKSGWGKPIKKGQGRGMALRTSFGSTAGHVAEVSVEKSSGRIRVHRIVCVLDCGPAVFPDAIRAQMEGGAIFALSAALKERVRFSKGGVSTANYDDYPILTMSETPEIEVHIVKSDDKIGGVGEPAFRRSHRRWAMRYSMPLVLVPGACP